jgi:hypothetical protein
LTKTDSASKVLISFLSLGRQNWHPIKKYKIRLQRRYSNKLRAIRLEDDKVSLGSLSVIYSSWTSLPSEKKAEFRYLQEQFRKNYTQIKSILKPKGETRPRTTGKTPVIDLREKLKTSQMKDKKSDQGPPIDRFIEGIKKTVQDRTYKTVNKKSFSSSLKNGIFDSYIQRDEPLRSLKETEMSRIPYKEQLLVPGNLFDIFLSGIRASADPSLILKNEIRAVISIGNCKQTPRFTAVTLGYFDVNITETETKIKGFKENLSKIIHFIDVSIKKGNILICCYYGCCRSPLIICAYLMIKYRIRLDLAFTILKKGRKCIRMSEAAFKYLNEIENTLFPPADQSIDCN